MVIFFAVFSSSSVIVNFIVTSFPKRFVNLSSQFWVSYSSMVWRKTMNLFIPSCVIRINVAR